MRIFPLQRQYPWQRIWLERYRSIVDLENHLHRNGTRIIKSFLRLSEEEQRKRFLDRIEVGRLSGYSDVEKREIARRYILGRPGCRSLVWKTVSW
jgi:hypothetical protein